MLNDFCGAVSDIRNVKEAYDVTPSYKDALIIEGFCLIQNSSTVEHAEVHDMQFEYSDQETLNQTSLLIICRE